MIRSSIQALRIAIMNKNHCTHSWLGSFAGRLLQLRPDFSLGTVVSCAVHSIHHAGNIDPHRAAEIFVLANSVPRKSGRSPRPAESPSANYRNLFGLRTTEPAHNQRPAPRDAPRDHALLRQ